jgi:micrococcal nuclease
VSNRSALRWAALFVLLAFVGAGGLGPFRDTGSGDGQRGDLGPGRGKLARTMTGRVVRVVDGDTVHVRLDHPREEQTVRYIGIDTPESVKPGTPVQCYAKRAAAANAALVAGREVRLVGDVEHRDRYGRLLAYVYRIGDGAFVNAALVRDGYARTLTIAPNVAHAAELARLARTARTTGRGLWRACAME